MGRIYPDAVDCTIAILNVIADKHRLATRIAELEGALEPFEDALQDVPLDTPDNNDAGVICGGITVGDLRNAAKVRGKKQ